VRGEVTDDAGDVVAHQLEGSVVWVLDHQRWDATRIRLEHRDPEALTRGRKDEQPGAAKTVKDCLVSLG